MRLLTLTGLALIVIAAPAVAKPCVRLDERALIRAPELIVVRGDAGEILACRRSNGRRVPMPSARYGVRDLPGDGITIAGTTVAWVSRLTPYRGTPSEGFLHVRDLARPERRWRGFLQFLPRELAASPDGRAAAISDAEVVVLDRNDRRQVAIGAPGTMTDLSIAGGEVTWTQAGQPRRAPLDVPASCRLERGDDYGIQGEHAAIAYQRDGEGGGWTPMLCRYEGGGWQLLPGTEADLAGEYVAVERQAGERLLVDVLDARTLDPVGAPVRLDETFDPWALAADGTVYVLSGGKLAGHRRDGTTVTINGGFSTGWRLEVDDLTRTLITFGPTGTVPLPQ